MVTPDFRINRLKFGSKIRTNFNVIAISYIQIV